MVADPNSVDHNLDVFLARLDGVKGRGSQWMARCPAHPDKTPSLSVRLGNDGRVLLHCHAGCATRDVLAALKLEPSDLFPTNGHRPELRRPRALGTPTVTYDYRDAAGTLVYQAVRYEPKDFRQRRPDPSAPGGWAWNLHGVSRVLYRLADVLAADAAETVYYCEGEKDADAGAALGLLTTTNSEGAEKLRPEAAGALRGRRVAILPDNDDAGHKGAMKTAALLANLAADVRIVTLPGLPKAGDLSDWLAAGGTVEDLARLTAEAPRWTPDEAPAATPLRPWRGQVLADVHPERYDWLSRGRLARGKLTVLDGDPGLGKSTLLADWAARLTTGRPLPDGPARPPTGVVLCSAEDGLGDTIRPRLDAVGADLSRVLAVTGIPDEDGERMLTLPDDVPALEAAIQEIGAVLAVLDPLMAYLGERTNSHRDQDVRRALAPLAAMAERTGCAVVAVRHLNKGSGSPALYRGGGSIGIIGAARFGLLVATDPDDERRRVLASTKCNLAEPPESLSFTLEPVGDVARVVWLGPSAHRADAVLALRSEEETSALAEAEAFLRDALAEGPRPALDVTREARQGGLADATIRRARGRLGIVSRREGFGSGGRWTWALPSPETPIAADSKRMSTYGNSASQQAKSLASPPDASIDVHPQEVSTYGDMSTYAAPLHPHVNAIRPAPAYVRHTQEMADLGEAGVLSAATGALWEPDSGTVDAPPARERVTL